MGLDMFTKLLNLQGTYQKSCFQVVGPVLQRNDYFAHHENLLLAMVTDERNHIRELGFRRIMKAKQAISESDSIRIFKLPNLNFEAKDYTEIIKWNTSTLTPSPLLRTLTNEDIKQYVRNDFKAVMSYIFISQCS